MLLWLLGVTVSFSNEGTTALRQLWRFWILLLLPLATFPCQGTAISGTVKTTAGVPIPNADVIAVAGARRFGAATDASGAYSINIIFSATYNVSAAKLGYSFTPASTNVGVTVGGPDVIINFTTPATVPSSFTFSAVTGTPFSETLYGEVNPNGAATTLWFDYGTTTNYGSTSTSTNIGSGTAYLIVGISVTNLLPGTLYHFRADASNSLGAAFGGDLTFTTLSGIPSVTTRPPTNGGATSMTLQGSVNPNGAGATAWFDFGTTTNYEFPPVIQSVGNGTASTNFSQTVIGLTTGTTYHYRAAASTSVATNYGADYAFAPLFNDATPAGLPALEYGVVAWADYDNDGLLDILIAGTTNFFSGFAEVWRNTGSGFTNINAGLTGFYAGAAAWGDYDNDGRADILLTGANFAFTNAPRFTQLWHNTSNGFVLNTNAVFAGVADGSVAWGDYDNDGRLDILLTGSVDATPAGAVSKVYHNNGDGTFTDINAGLPGVFRSSVAWGDFDNDGRLDILLTGYSATGYIAQVWRNTGNGFSNINAGLPGVGFSAVAVGDYDNDGWLDILLTGWSPSLGAVAQVWRNTGGSFVNINAGLPGVSGVNNGNGSVAWGDYDNDGRLDILLTGWSPSLGAVAQIWRNTGNGFTNINAALWPGVFDGSVAWGDYDNKGRLDILVSGRYYAYPADFPVVRLWRNNTPNTNNLPLPPSGLHVALSNNSVTMLTWNPSSDNQTPVSGLTYNVRIGTAPGGSDVLSSMSADSGFRRVPRMGNAGGRLFLPFKNYGLGPYYWSVQAVDTAFAGSSFASEGSFKFLSYPVPVTAGNIIPGDLDGDGIVDQNELNTVLSNYWPYSPWIYMTNTTGLGQTNVQFAFTNPTAWDFSVLVSTNLVDWVFLGPAYPMYQFVDPFATNAPQRYYRLRWP